MHFGGEYGDDPGRNAEVNKAMKELRCDTVETAVGAIKLKYHQNKAVQDALLCASSL